MKTLNSTFRIWILFATIVFANTTANSQVVINELCAENESTITDDDGEYSDWIELINKGNEPVNLIGWALSDELGNAEWIFPEFHLQPGELLLVFASGKNKSEGPTFHTNFKISDGEERACLYNNNGSLIDFTDTPGLGPDYSIGRKPDGNGNFITIINPSPGVFNTYAIAYVTSMSEELDFSHSAGFYDSPFDLVIHSPDPHSVIYYTTDGSEPGLHSEQYSDGISLASVNNNSVISQIPTSDSWQMPTVEPDNCIVIKARAFKGSIPVSKTTTKTFFTTPENSIRYPVDVVSLSINDSDLFDPVSGIYVNGENEYPNYAYHGDEWEREAFIEVFSSSHELIISQQVGIRIHGRSSRFYPQKSLRLYADEKYGAENFSYPFFGESSHHTFKRLLLRTPDQMFSQSLLIDPVIRQLSQEMNVDLQAFKPAVVFINGVYWGIHQLSERLDKYYLASKYGLDKEKIDILDYDSKVIVNEGNADLWNELQYFLESHDLADDNAYAHIEAEVDIAGFLDFLCAELFYANLDFPRVNQRLWRSQEEGGKWRFFLFDLDNSMRAYDDPTIENFLFNDQANDPASMLFRSLMRNEKFSSAFVDRMIYHLSKTFEPTRMIAQLNESVWLHSPLMNDHIHRWNIPDNFDAWSQSIADIRNFLLRRSAIVADQISSLLPDPFIVYPQPATELINITSKSPSSDQTISAQLMTQQGSLCDTPFSRSSNSIQLNTSHLAEGVYILQLNMGKMIYHKKVVII